LILRNKSSKKSLLGCNLRSTLTTTNHHIHVDNK
jgi:hypothetical protein